MALAKIATNKWRINVSVRNKVKGFPIGKQETFYGTSAEAKLREAELLKELRSQGSLTPLQRASTFRDLIDLYKTNLVTQGRCGVKHSDNIDFIARKLGAVKLSGFEAYFNRYWRGLNNGSIVCRKPLAAGTINRLTGTVRAVFNHALKLELIDKNPITTVNYPKLKERPRDRYLKITERDKLLSTIREYRPELLPIIQYMLLVPCRKSELTAAKREQYNQVSGTIYIPDSKAGIPIHKPVPEEMQDYFNSIPSDCPWLFFWRDKSGAYRRWGSLQGPWADCLCKAGLTDLRIHDLRHIAATDLYEAGNAERVIMDVAGWKTPMLSTYRHKDSLRSAQGIKFGHAQGYEVLTNNNVIRASSLSS